MATLVLNVTLSFKISFEFVLRESGENSGDWWCYTRHGVFWVSEYRLWLETTESNWTVPWRLDGCFVIIRPTLRRRGLNVLESGIEGKWYCLVIMETDHLEDLGVDGRLDNIKMDIKEIVLFLPLLLRINMLQKRRLFIVVTWVLVKIV
jgi:hypothetical protein